MIEQTDTADQVGEDRKNGEDDRDQPKDLRMLPFRKDKKNGQHLKQRGQLPDQVRLNTDLTRRQENDHESSDNQELSKYDDHNNPKRRFQAERT